MVPKVVVTNCQLQFTHFFLKNSMPFEYLISDGAIFQSFEVEHLKEYNPNYRERKGIAWKLP